MEPTEAYRQAIMASDGVMTSVPADAWDGPSPCEAWTLRDVAGHVTWGVHLVTHLALGEEFTSREGAPGSATPGTVVGPDPLATWTAARDAVLAALTPDVAARPGPAAFVARDPNATLGDFLPVVTTDMVGHAWDLAHGTGTVVATGPDLLEAVTSTSRRIVNRSTGMFGPEQPAPADADGLTRFAAYLGRRV